MKEFTILILVCTIGTTLAIAQKPPERCSEVATASSLGEELKKLDRALDDAAERGDTTLFQNVLAEEMINIDPQGTISKKAAVLQNVQPPKAGTKLTITAADIQTFVVGTTGIVTSNKTQKWEWKNGSNSDHYRETNTYARQNGQWRLVASQTSHAPPPYSAKDVDLNIAIDESQVCGNQNAPVVLIEFADYECPYCRQFANDTFKQIERDYIDAKRIGFVFHDFPLESSHPNAFKAAWAAQCAAAQGHLWEMNRKLLAESALLTQDHLLSNAEAIGLNMPAFSQCLVDESLSGLIRRKMQEATKLGIDGTPMFVVGIRKPGSNKVRGLRMIEGGYPYDVFRATLDSLLATQD